MLGGLYSTSTTLKAAPGVGEPSVGLAGSSSYELEKFERMLKREKIWDLAKEEKKAKRAKDSSTDRRYHKRITWRNANSTTHVLGVLKMTYRNLLLSVAALFVAASSAFAGDCVAPCTPVTPSCDATPAACAPVCAPAACKTISVPCIRPLATLKAAASCAVADVNCAAANIKARLAALKPCCCIAPCAPACVAPCAPAAPTCEAAPAPCAPAAPSCEAAPSCAPATCALPCVKFSCNIKPFQALKARFARPCLAAPACVAPCAPAAPSCEAAPAPACAPVAPCTPAC